MHGVLVGIEQPAGLWCRATTHRYEDLEVRVLNMAPLQDGGLIETIELRGPEAAAAWDRMQEMDGLDYAIPVLVSRTHVQAKIRVTKCPLAHILRKADAVPMLPFEAAKGQDRWLLNQDAGEAARVMEALTDGRMHVTVHRAGDWEAREHDLTERQRDVLEAAIHHGYYANPRHITLTRLAARIGVSKSALCETLLVIESKVMRAPRASFSPVRDLRRAPSG